MSIIITQKHINKMIQQGTANTPYPSGGFLGGKIQLDNKIILGIYPVKKILLEHINIGFCYTEIDFENAQNYFFRNNIMLFGSYNIIHNQKKSPLINRKKIGYGCQEIITIDLSNSKSPIISAHENKMAKK